MLQRLVLMLCGMVFGLLAIMRKIGRADPIRNDGAFAPSTGSGAEANRSLRGGR